MMNLDEFKRILEEMTPRSLSFQLIKAELEKRGHWRAKPRGMKNPLRNLAGAEPHITERSQVTTLPYKDSDDFSDGM